MSSNTRNIKLGVCQVTWDGVDLGLTQGGVEIAISTTSHEVKVDQYGDTPVDDYITGRTCKAKVPLVETTIANMARIMPGAVLKQSGGTKATGTLTFSTAAPVDGDSVTLNGVVFSWATNPLPNTNDMPIAGTFSEAAAGLAAKINASTDPLVSRITASANLGVVTLTADEYGVEANDFTLASDITTTANLTLSGAKLTGGANPSIEGVSVPTGVGISLLKTAKKLVFHPQGLPAADKSEDFIMPLANTPGAATFNYKLDAERVFNVEFNAYPDSSLGVSGKMFYFGNEDADA
jgi:hypothetical protein